MLYSLNFFYKFYTYFWIYLKVFSTDYIFFIFLSNFKLVPLFLKKNLQLIKLNKKFLNNFFIFFKLKFSKRIQYFFNVSNFLIILPSINLLNSLMFIYKINNIDIIGLYTKGFFLNIWNITLLNQYIILFKKYLNKQKFFKNFYLFFFKFLFFKLFIYFLIVKINLIYCCIYLLKLKTKLNV